MHPGVNVYAHMDHAASIIAYRTHSIDAFMQPPDGPNTIDWARTPDGRFYSAKAPGAAFAVVPVWAVLFYLESAAGIDPLRGEWFRRNIVVANWIVNGFVSALAMVLLLRLLVASGFGGRSAVFAVIGIGLGTTYYPYATSFYAHNLTANLGIAALFVLFAVRPSPVRDALAGVLVGFAVMCDYSAAHAVPVVGAALLAVRQRAIVPFVIGGLLPAAALAAYHTAVFGGPFLTAYTFQNPEFEPSQGGLFALPKLRTLLSLTVGPYRGVFFFCPGTPPSTTGRCNRHLALWMDAHTARRGSAQIAPPPAESCSADRCWSRFVHPAPSV